MKETRNNSDFTDVPCLICGGFDTKSISHKGKFNLPTHVSICINDGLVYLNPRWTEKRYKQFYSEEYDQYHRPQILSPDEKGKYNSGNQIWERLKNNQIKSFNSILDIGAGMGWTLDFIRNQVNDCKSFAAIESSDYCAKHIKNTIGAEFLASDVETDWQQNYSKQFDLVIMRHVLEHFLNPIEVLKKVNYVLSSNGYIYIAVPNMMLPFGSLKDSWFRVVHTYYFSTTTLLRVAARANLEPKIIQTHGNEIWGIFKKASPKYKEESTSVFIEQIKIIETYRRKRFFKEIVIFLPKIMSKYFSTSFKAAIPKIIRGRLKKYIFDR